MNLLEEADTAETAKLIRQIRDFTSQQKLTQPRTIHYWTIPSAVLLAALIWAGFGVHLAGLGARQPTAETLLLATMAAVVTATTALYAMGYLLHRSIHRGHQVLLDELERLRRQRIDDRQAHQAAIVEVRTRVLAILDRMNNVNEARYAGMAEGVRMVTATDDSHAADVLRLTRRPGS
jgi:hypothetical protein